MGGKRYWTSHFCPLMDSGNRTGNHSNRLYCLLRTSARESIPNIPFAPRSFPRSEGLIFFVSPVCQRSVLRGNGLRRRCPEECEWNVGQSLSHLRSSVNRGGWCARARQGAEMRTNYCRATWRLINRRDFRAHRASGGSCRGGWAFMPCRARSTQIGCVAVFDNTASCIGITRFCEVPATVDR
jgi:hypothetical protein